MKIKKEDEVATFDVKGKSPKEFFSEYFGSEADDISLLEPFDDVVVLEVKKDDK